MNVHSTAARDLLLTAIAPVVWGSTYLVTTEFLPSGHPLALAALRVLPAGVLLLALAPVRPQGAQWWQAVVLGALQFALFGPLLFVAADRLPGGVAATVGAIQPIVVLVLARAWLGERSSPAAILAAIVGVAGVALLVLAPGARLDVLGVGAALAGTACMAAGTVLSRRWRPQVSVMAFTSWQLVAGGVLLAPFVILLEGPLPPTTREHVLGIAYLSLVGAAATVVLWQRGISRLSPITVSALGLLAPVTAVALDGLVLGRTLDPPQLAGALLILLSLRAVHRTTATTYAAAHRARS
ncbi:MAG: DMT family transporter [Planctomycetota bacterium]